MKLQSEFWAYARNLEIEQNAALVEMLFCQKPL